MKLAILSDIHGNIFAFNAILKDLEKYSVDNFIFLGDLVFNGLYPQQCYDTLQNLNPLYCIKGNTDFNIEEVDSYKPSNEFEKYLHSLTKYNSNNLNDEAKKTIKEWPISKKVKICGFDIIFCHGSPYNPKENLTKRNPNFENLSKKIIDENINYIFCGHTHFPENYLIGKTNIINSGAIGYSLDNDWRPSYLIVDIDESGVVFHHHRVSYDVEEYVETIKQNSIFSDDLIYILRNGNFQKSVLEKMKKE